MSDTGSSVCTSCGRPRWTGDRFCAKCGEAFGIEFVPTSTGQPDTEFSLAEPPPQMEVRSLAREQVEPDKQPVNRYLVSGLVGLGLVMLLVIGISALTSRGSNDGSEGAAEPEATAELAPLPLSVPTSTPVPTRRPVSTPSPPSTPTSAPDATRIAEPPVFEETAPPFGNGQLTGYLALQGNGEIQLIDLTTGKAVDTPALDSGPVLVSQFGVVHSRFSTSDRPDWYIAAWGDTELRQLDLGDELSPVFTLEDEAGSLLVMTGSDAGADADEQTADQLFTVMHLETGETQQIEVAAALQWEVLETWLNQPDQYSAGPLLLSTGAGVHHWRWNDGWVKVSDGLVSLASADLAIVDQCETPADCSRSLVSLSTGEELGEVSPDVLFSSFGSEFSPGGRFVGYVDWELFPSVTRSPTEEPSLVVIDTSTGETTDLGVLTSGMGTWIGDRDLLLWKRSPGSSSSFEVVDVETGISTPLDLEARDFSVVTWFPELAGLPGSSQG